MIRNGWVGRITFSPDGQYLASSDCDYLYIWNVETEMMLWKDKRTAYDVAFSPNGKYVVSCGLNGYLWVDNIITGTVLQVLLHNVHLVSVCFRQDGLYVAVAGQLFTVGERNLIAMENIVTGERREYHARGNPDFIAISPDGKYLAVAFTDKVYIWHIPTHNVVFRSIQGEPVAFNYDGRYLFIGPSRVYNWKDKKLLLKGGNTLDRFERRFMWGTFAKIHDVNISSMALSRRGFLAIGYKDGKIEVIREGKGI